jgi:hypothetical protein
MVCNYLYIKLMYLLLLKATTIHHNFIYELELML